MNDGMMGLFTWWYQLALFVAGLVGLWSANNGAAIRFWGRACHFWRVRRLHQTPISLSYTPSCLPKILSILYDYFLYSGSKIFSTARLGYAC
jgi:hypothetical protein